MEKSRKPLRLPSFDYTTSGVYFITICTHHMQNTLCTIQCRGGPGGLPQTKFSELGIIAKETMAYINNMTHITVDKFVIMPNHVHLMIRYDKPFFSETGKDICRIVGAYKSKVSTEWLKICKSRDVIMGSVWQRSFMDHVIRNETDYLIHWQYIDNNPLKWEEDKYFNK